MWRVHVNEGDRQESERETGKMKEDVERASEGGRQSERERARKMESAKERPRSEEEKKLSIRLFSSLKRGVPFYILPGFQG